MSIVAAEDLKELFALAGIPLLIFLGIYSFYYIDIESWIDNPAKHFESIKGTLDKYGNLNSTEKQHLDNQTVTLSLAKKAIDAAIPDYYTIIRAIIPIVIIAAVFYIYGILSGAFSNNIRIVGLSDSYYVGALSSMKGDKKTTNGTIPREPRYSPVLTFPATQITFRRDINQTILTVNGVIISIIGGFLIASGPKHFLTIYGFLILIASMMSAFLAITFISESIRSEKEGELTTDRMGMCAFASAAQYAFWYFMMGLLIIIGSLI